MKTLIALAVLVAGQMAVAAPTQCKEKVMSAADSAMQLEDPNGEGYAAASAEPVIEAWSEASSGDAQDNLHIWKVKEVSKPGQNLPTAYVYVISQGDQFGGCTIAQIIGSK